MTRLLVPLLVATLVAAGCGTRVTAPTDPLSAAEHNDLGVAYYARGEHALAAREFRRALAVQPGWTRAQVNLGDARLAMGEIDGAIAAYEEARAANPKDPTIANNLAWALLHHRKRWGEAEALIREALSHDPEPRGYYLDTLGLLLLKQGTPRRALATFRAALADRGLEDPEVRGLVLHHTGQALARLGDTVGAERCFRAARAVRDRARPGDRPLPGTLDPAAAEVGDGETVC